MATKNDREYWDWIASLTNQSGMGPPIPPPDNYNPMTQTSDSWDDLFQLEDYSDPTTGPMAQLSRMGGLSGIDISPYTNGMFDDPNFIERGGWIDQLQKEIPPLFRLPWNPLGKASMLVDGFQWAFDKLTGLWKNESTGEISYDMPPELRSGVHGEVDANFQGGTPNLAGSDVSLLGDMGGALPSSADDFLNDIPSVSDVLPSVGASPTGIGLNQNDIGNALLGNQQTSLYGGNPYDINLGNATNTLGGGSPSLINDATPSVFPQNVNALPTVSNTPAVNNTTPINPSIYMGDGNLSGSSGGVTPTNPIPNTNPISGGTTPTGGGTPSIDPSNIFGNSNYPTAPIAPAYDTTGIQQPDVYGYDLPDPVVPTADWFNNIA